MSKKPAFSTPRIHHPPNQDLEGVFCEILDKKNLISQKEGLHMHLNQLNKIAYGLLGVEKVSSVFSSKELRILRNTQFEKIEFFSISGNPEIYIHYTTIEAEKGEVRFVFDDVNQRFRPYKNELLSGLIYNPYKTKANFENVVDNFVDILFYMSEDFNKELLAIFNESFQEFKEDYFDAVQKTFGHNKNFEIKEKTNYYFRFSSLDNTKTLWGLPIGYNEVVYFENVYKHTLEIHKKQCISKVRINTH